MDWIADFDLALCRGRSDSPRAAWGLVSDKMESDEHQKRIPVEDLRRMLERIGFKNFLHRRFEFGLNNLMVATRQCYSRRRISIN